VISVIVPGGYGSVLVSFRLETDKFLCQSDDRKYLENNGSWYGIFSTRILLPCSVYIFGRFRLVPAGERLKFVGKNIDSCSILLDPMARIIDLVSYFIGQLSENSFSSIYSIYEWEKNP
jgi:hypothetical protein